MVKKIKTIISSLLAGVLNGIIGTGGGTVIYLANDRGAEGQKYVQCFMIMLVGVFSASGAVLTVKDNALAIKDTLCLLVGCIIGGILGARFVKEASGKSIKILFSVLLIVSGIKMLL